MLPLNGWSVEGTRPSAMTRSTASAPVYSTFARVVSKWVLFGTTLPGPPMAEKRIFSAARPWCVGMMCRNGNSVRTDSTNAIPGRRPGVRLIAALDARPLVARHRAGPRVGQEVDDDVVGVEVEEVPAGLAEGGLALLHGLELDRLDRVDAEGLDDGLPAFHPMSIRATDPDRRQRDRLEDRLANGICPMALASTPSLVLP